MSSVALPSLSAKLEKRANRKRRKRKHRRGDAYPLEKVRSGGGKKSKRKGAHFEQQIAKLFASYLGCSVRRSPGSGAWATNAGFGARGDLVFSNRYVPFCVECKRHEGFDLADLITGVRSKDTTSTNSIERWWQQCIRDAYAVTDDRKIPMLVFARNRQLVGKAETVGLPPLVMMLTTDLYALAKVKKDGVSLWDASFIKQLTFATDECVRSIITLDDFFKYVRPPRKTPRRKTWKRGEG